MLRPLNNQQPRYLADGRLDPGWEVHLSDGQSTSTRWSA